MDVQFPILAIGDFDAAEFADAAGSLARQGAMIVPDVPAAVRAIDGGFAPALVILAQCWPGEFPSRQIDALRRAAPLARIINLLGPWMEGETRSGKPIAGALRVYWHQWTDLAGQLETPNRWSVWSLPQTASEDQRLLSEQQFPPSDRAARGSGSLLIAVVADEGQSAQSLTAMCERRGWQSVWLRSIAAEISFHPDAILFDAAHNSQTDMTQLARLQVACHNCPIVVLAGFPRAEDVSPWKSAGATAIVSKPFLTRDLLREIERLTGKSAATNG